MTVKEKIILKLLVSGEGAVGKTCFMNRYCNDVFDPKSPLTKGVDFFCSKIYDNGVECDLSIYDFGGQEQFRFMLKEFVKGARGAFFLFDLTRLSTLDHLNEWFEIIGTHEKVPVLIVGTKRDLIDEDTSRSIKEHVDRIVNQYDFCIGYIEVSSKTGENIERAVDFLVSKILQTRVNHV
ncbi:MAG: Rab family GTPase [Promethearchaeota archaeon]